MNLHCKAWFLAGVFILMTIAKFTAFQNNCDDIQILPSVVDTGENLEGLTVEKAMRIKNSFGFDAKFDEVVTGCGCLSIWDGSGSLARPIDQTNFVVGAKSEQTIVARLNLEGLSGGIDRSFVFRSKDSRIKPIVGRIIGKVKGRIRVSTKEVNLGEIPMEEKRFAFSVSGMASGNSIKDVVPGTNCFPGFADSSMRLSYKRLSTTEFSIEGALKPEVVGDFCKLVEINFSDGLPAVKVRVFGKAMKAVILSPSSVYLPRRSGTGYLFSTQITCTATFGKIITLSPVIIPDGLKVKISSTEVANELKINIDASSFANSSKDVLLCFNVDVDGSSSQVKIPLSINRK